MPIVKILEHDDGSYDVKYPNMKRSAKGYDSLTLTAKEFLRHAESEETTEETVNGVHKLKVYTPPKVKPSEAKKSARNKKSRHEGARFEEQIEMACKWYAITGKGFIQKTPEPLKTVGRLPNGKVMAYHEKQAQPDFTGTLAGGQSIVFDAKYTDYELIRQDVVTDTQTHDLNMHQSMGAACYILVGHEGRAFLVPWTVFSNMKERYDHKYMTILNLQQYEVKKELMVNMEKRLREEGGKSECKNLSGYAPLFLEKL